MLLITGGTGYVGQKLLQLLPSNQKIFVLSRRRSSLPFKNVEVISGDLLQPESLAGKFKDVTKVIHLASITHAQSEQEYWDHNFIGTKNLLAALPKDTLTSFVYSSTNCAVPGAGGYGESKLAVEELLLETLHNVVILKIGDVFGGAGEKSLEKLFKMVQESTIVPLIGLSETIMAPVHVDDVTKLLVLSLKIQGKHTFIVTGSEKISFKNLVLKIAEKNKKKIIPLPIPSFVIELLIRILVLLKVGDYYPDQVKRFVASKELDSTKTWKFFKRKPIPFSSWFASISW
jgi:nucleoside-diphosphate-sugar epimerase